MCKSPVVLVDSPSVSGLMVNGEWQVRQNQNEPNSFSRISTTYKVRSLEYSISLESPILVWSVLRSKPMLHHFEHYRIPFTKALHMIFTNAKYHVHRTKVNVIIINRDQVKIDIHIIFVNQLGLPTVCNNHNASFQRCTEYNPR